MGVIAVTKLSYYIPSNHVWHVDSFKILIMEAPHDLWHSRNINEQKLSSLLTEVKVKLIKWTSIILSGKWIIWQGNWAGYVGMYSTEALFNRIDWILDQGCGNTKIRLCQVHLGSKFLLSKFHFNPTLDKYHVNTRCIKCNWIQVKLFPDIYKLRSIITKPWIMNELIISTWHLIPHSKQLAEGPV